MAIAPIGSVSSTHAAGEVTKPVAPAVSAQAAAAVLKPDTVQISTAGRAARDGDSDAS